MLYLNEILLKCLFKKHLYVHFYSFMQSNVGSEPWRYMGEEYPSKYKGPKVHSRNSEETRVAGVE